MKKPEPVPTATVCSLCGLPWDRHPEEATAEDCVALLKQDLAKRYQLPYQQSMWHTMQTPSAS